MIKAGSNLENILTNGQFAVTGELGPPKSGNYDVVREKARILKGYVDAANITDCQTAIVRMSSLTAGLIAMSEGVEPVMQMTCRDRNRIAIQAEVLGASALGIKNLLCLTGDHQKFGNHPQSKGVFDMDSIQLLGMIRQMRDEKRFQCGEEIKEAEPRLFLGAAANPFADPFEYRPKRLAKKVSAGASFVQTQIIYNVEKFKKFMEMVCDLGLHEKVYILAGVTPPKSLGMARYMKNNVPGLDVTDDIIKRLQGAKDQKEEGINIAVDIINQVREIKGVHGVHVMAIEWEQAVPEIVKRAGLDKRPEMKGFEPRLGARAEIEDAVKKAEQESGRLAPEIDRLKNEVTAANAIAVKEQDRVSGLSAEVERLKKEVRDTQLSMEQKEKEVSRLRAELSQAMSELEAVKAQAASGQSIFVQEQDACETDFIFDPSGGDMTARDQVILNSLTLGLESLRKALGLNEDQFEAIKRFMEAQFVISTGGRQSPAVSAAPVTTAKAVESKPVRVIDTKPAQSEVVADVVAPSIQSQEDLLRKEVVNLIAKANVAMHKKDYETALKTFESALAIDASDVKAQEGAKKARNAMGTVAQPAVSSFALPARPDEITPEQWSFKWLVRYVAQGNVALSAGDKSRAVEAFRKALAIDSKDEKAVAGLKNAEAMQEGAISPKPEMSVAIQPEAVAPKSEPVLAAVRSEVQPEVKAKPAMSAVEAKPVAVTSVAAPVSAGDFEFAREAKSLTERAGAMPANLFIERCSGSIKPVTIGDGDKAVTVGGMNTLPFHLFEGEMANAPRIALDVLDVAPEDWPDSLARHYSDVIGDPVKWAQKSVNEYSAEAICFSMVSADPNGLNRPAKDVAAVAKAVVDAVDVPVIVWGCGNAEKDTELLRELTGLTGNKKVCIAPLTDANYRGLGATAMALQIPVVAATPIDVNLAKQLNILLENLGVSLSSILMDTSIGAVGYGLEYTYSVMERIRLAALTQQDEKLSVPFICNLGREVWKTKETKQPSSELLGDQERRGIMMEAVTAASLMLAGGELMIMRHPQAVRLAKAFIQGLM